jgi:hypothetical protein
MLCRNDVLFRIIGLFWKNLIFELRLCCCSKTSIYLEKAKHGMGSNFGNKLSILMLIQLASYVFFFWITGILFL